jgi:hypothetical protein
MVIGKHLVDRLTTTFKSYFPSLYAKMLRNHELSMEFYQGFILIQPIAQCDYLIGFIAGSTTATLFISWLVDNECAFNENRRFDLLKCGSGIGLLVGLLATEISFISRYCFPSSWGKLTNVWLV